MVDKIYYGISVFEIIDPIYQGLKELLSIRGKIDEEEMIPREIRFYEALLIWLLCGKSGRNDFSLLEDRFLKVIEENDYEDLSPKNSDYLKSRSEDKLVRALNKISSTYNKISGFDNKKRVRLPFTLNGLRG